MVKFVVLNVDQVIQIHQRVIGPHELQGLAKDKSLEAVLERVHNRLQYGFITDAFDLAACYGVFIAKAHCFHDANKRTAAATAFFVLEANEISLVFANLELGDWIIAIAENKKTEVEFGAWLRGLSKQA